MLTKEDTIKSIEERIGEITSSEICALFLIEIDGKGQEDPKVLERMYSLLTRSFRATDIVGYMGKNLFAAFLTGNLTGKVIEDKSETLSDALLFAEEDISMRNISSYVGAYVFREGKDSMLEIVLRRAEYALEMAKKEEHRRFFIYGADGVFAEDFQSSGSPMYSKLLTAYIDEGVRILEAGKDLKVIFTSPGFYRRLSIPENYNHSESVRIHPSDQEAYEQLVRSAAENGGPEEGNYRVSGDGIRWIACRVRLLRVSRSDQSAIVLEISHNTAGLQQLKEQYDEKREWLSFVADETDDQLWEVDLKTRTFRLLYTKNLLDGRQTVYENFPESLIQNGRIHKDSADRFRDFAEEMYGGKPEGRANFVIQYRQTSCYGWSSMSYHLMFDAEGRPEKAIGIKEDLSYLPNWQSRFIQRRIMPADLYPYMYCYLQANLTQDIPEKLQLEGKEQIRLIRYQTYTDIIERGIFRLFSASAVKRLQRRFDRKHLLAEYKFGKRWFFDQCQVICFEGSVQWVTMGVNLCEDPESGDVCLFLYALNQNKLRRWELELGRPAVRNPVTGIYDEKTYEEMVRHLLRKEVNTVCAFILIRVEGAEELFGTEEDRRKPEDLMTALHTFLGTDCVIGQAEGYSLLVFCPEAVSRNHIRKKLENAFSFTRISLGDIKEMMFLRFVAGAAYDSAENMDYEKVMQDVSKLCTVYTGEASDAVFFVDEDGKYRWSSMELYDCLDEKDTYVLTPDHMMTEECKDAALACMDWMLNADSADHSIDGVLKRIGRFYQADRVYILVLTEDARIVTMINEWVGEGKYSIQQSISGKRIEKFPVIMRAAHMSEPLILSLKSQDQKGNWQYVIFPMEKEKDIIQLLCVENPRAHIEQTAFLDQVIPHLSREHKRFLQRTSVSPIDRLFAIPNIQSYQNMVYSINSDTCSSAGVMTVDIPDFQSVKEQRGYEYGNRFLLKVSEVLLDIFGKSLVFRIRETEFVALCKDITYETFFNKCTRVQQLLGRNYSGQFRVGCIWSDGIFNAKDLVERARSIMRCATSSEMSDPSYRTREVISPEEDSPWLKKQTSGRFMIYLQPKVDMRSERLVGAEALVRIADAQGNLMPHGRVIEEMENEGTIQELDYFVFDQALCAMSQWLQKGYPLVPVSSNFSRNTLLNPSSLASILAILSRYPDIPQDMVELEITETAGDYGNKAISELIQRFDGYGLQFSLDDCGGCYSNMSMLTDLHFHSVKLDRSMIRNISGNTASRTLVRDIVKLCKDSQMLCIAEGVETKEQADLLLEDGCLYGQGYYYGRPMPLQEFEKKYFQMR